MNPGTRYAINVPKSIGAIVSFMIDILCQRGSGFIELLIVDPLLQFLPAFEKGQFFRRYLDEFSGLGVPPGVCFVFFYIDAA